MVFVMSAGGRVRASVKFPDTPEMFFTAGSCSLLVEPACYPTPPSAVLSASYRSLWAVASTRSKRPLSRVLVNRQPAVRPTDNAEELKSALIEPDLMQNSGSQDRNPSKRPRARSSDDRHDSSHRGAHLHFREAAGADQRHRLSLCVRLFLVTCRHVLYDAPSLHFLNRIEIGVYGLVLAIRQSSEEDPIRICTDPYGYEPSGLFHSVAPKLDLRTEEKSKEALALVSLLLALGLPSQAASTVVLAGVRSGVAAAERGFFRVDATANAKNIRDVLPNPETVEKLRSSSSSETSTWLDLLARDQTSSTEEIPSSSNFNLDAPPEIASLHCRLLPAQDTAFVCATDSRFAFRGQAIKEPVLRNAHNPHRHQVLT